MNKEEIIKEFYRKFTHDWPPVFYTEEEMPKIAKKVADYFEKALKDFKKTNRDMKKITAILEAITGIGGILIIGFGFSWWIALAIFLLMFSWNLHEHNERMKFKGIEDY